MSDFVAPDKTIQSSPRKTLLGWLMKPFTDIREAEEAAIRRQRLEVQFAGDVIANLPGGRGLLPEVHEMLVRGISKVDSNTIAAVQKHLRRCNEAAGAILDSLKFSSNPTFALRRIANHFEHVYFGLGWDRMGYPGGACDFIIENLPENGLSIEQERALLSLRSSLYYQDHHPSDGGVFRKPGVSYRPAATQCALERPQDIDRIIALAQERNPLHVEDYRALLDSGISGALTEGAL